MMKTYMKPEVLLEKIELQQMIALSAIDDENADPDGEVLSRQADAFNDNSNARRPNLWDDEESEDY